MATTTVFFNVLIMIIYMICGYALVKFGKADSEHARSISGVLVYLCSPCMILSAYQGMKDDINLLIGALKFFAVSFVVQIIFLSIVYCVFKSKMDNAKFRVLTAASISGNVGFFGLPVVTSIFPNEPIVACYSTMFVVSMNMILFTFGTFMLTRDKKFISVKQAILSPATITTLIAIPLFLLKVRFPVNINNSISLLGKMTTPLCMFVLGMRLTTMSFKKIFSEKFAYLAAFIKLIVFPLFVYGCVYFVPWLDDTFKVSFAILSSAPTASVLLSLAEIHKCERKICANTLLLATIGSLITMPLIAWIVS